MTKIRLIRSGWLAGKILTAEIETDIDEKELREMLDLARSPADRQSRDAMIDTIVINDRDRVQVDLERLKQGKLRELIEVQLEGRLSGK